MVQQRGLQKRNSQVNNEQDISFQPSVAFGIKTIHFIGSANQMAVSV